MSERVGPDEDGVYSSDGATACRRIDLELDADGDVLALLARASTEASPFLLDSGDESHRDGHYSLIGWSPYQVFRARGGRSYLKTDHDEHELGPPLEALGELLQATHVDAALPEGLPFAGGAVGFFSYDLGRCIERLPEQTVDDLNTDDICLGFYNWVLIRDHQAAQWLLAATARRGGAVAAEDLLDSAEAEVRRIAARTPAPDLREVSSFGTPPPLPPSDARVAFSHPEYVAAVERAIEHIFAGDIYQVNLSQRFCVPATTAPVALYQHLRARTHAIFSAYLEAPGMQVLSLSPERFLRVRGRAVETCPIKGTRPRGDTPEADAALAAELVASAKDRAELSMIVDLERNDLGRVCVPGSVQVRGHAELYSLATVHHTVTTVVGELRPDVDAAALLRATFPGGSITGAPKIRAMEIIEDLEPTRRGVYTGSVGYLAYNGDLDLNIAIRTVTLKDGLAYVQAGGGLVADSDPEGEYEETLTKARALLAALGAALPETPPI